MTLVDNGCIQISELGIERTIIYKIMHTPNLGVLL